MLSYPRTLVLVLLCLALLALAASPLFAAPAPANAPQFSVSFPTERSAQPLDGRLLLLLSNDPSAEPRMQINLSYKT